MNFDLKLGRAASVLFLALAMAGCGGGGSTQTGETPTGPMPTPVDLSGVTAGYEIGAGTYEISAGASMTVGDVMFSCAAGGADCTVMVDDDGMASYATDGGMVTAMNSAAYQARLNTQGELETANRIIMLHQEASGAATDAEAAGMAAAQAVKDAVKYSGMLDTASVMGDSTKARMNALMVLNAKKAADQAVVDANAAKMRVGTAKTTADALADGTEGKTEVLQAIDIAMKAVDAVVVTVTAISTGMNADETNNEDGQMLKTAVQAVTGTNMKDLKDEDDIASGVAMAVAGALLPAVPDTVADATTHDGTARRVTHYASTTDLDAATPPAVSMRTFHDANNLGRTWAMIVGEDNIMMERIGANNAATPVASIAGMDASAVDKTTTPVLASDGGTNSDGKYPDGSAQGAATVTGTAGTEYKGIPGAVWCLGGAAGCSVNSAGKLSEGWYFTPTSVSAVYILNPTAAERATTRYVAETDYASWGHWLAVSTEDATAGEVTVHTYATAAGNTASLNLAADTATEDPVNTATYTGSAAGMSVHKTYDGNNKQTGIDSGAFTAEVSLTAKFGTTPMLEGRVWNFQGGAHTDPNWSVKLQETGLTADATFAAGTLGVAKGSGQAGDWTAQGHGAADERPTGFFGNFEAHFTDGHASGAYAARAEEQ